MIKSAQTKVLEKIVIQESQNPDVIGISVFGSVARGEERSNSDLDITVISLADEEYNYSTKIIDKIYVDRVVYSKEFLLMRVNKYPYLSYGQYTSKIQYDPTGLLGVIKDELKLYFNNHPEVVKFWKEKDEYVKQKKIRGEKPELTMKSYDEAEILFSNEHRVTRSFFNS